MITDRHGHEDLKVALCHPYGLKRDQQYSFARANGEIGKHIVAPQKILFDEPGADSRRVWWSWIPFTGPFCVSGECGLDGNANAGFQDVGV